MRTIVTFDLDSTLCDTQHRYHMIDRVNGTDWAEYSQACSDDELVEGVALLVKSMELAGHEIHYVTGRMDVARQQTVDWLRHHLEETADVTRRLHMDDTDDHVKRFGSHAAYKVHKLLTLRDELKAKLVLHVDDYSQVGLRCAEVGIPCVVVRPPFEVRGRAPDPKCQTCGAPGVERDGVVRCFKHDEAPQPFQDFR